jgi:hypothetical protein
MDKRWLAIAVSLGLMAGCNSNNSNSVTTEFAIQAFDGPVWGMGSKAICDDGQTYFGSRTLHSGYAFFDDAYPRDNPGSCSFEFGKFTGSDGDVAINGNYGAIVDTTNNKDLSKVTYTTPKGMFTSGQPAAASPLTTLITEFLAESGEETYSTAAASQVLTDLGLDNVQDVDAFMKNPEKEIEKLKTADPATYKRALAVNATASDVVQSLQTSSDVQAEVDSFAKILNLTNNLADGLEADPGFSALVEAGKPVKVELADTIVTAAESDEGLGDVVTKPPGEFVPDDDFNDVIGGGVSEGEVVPEPEDPTDPPGTGGTGGGGAGGGSGN